MIHFPQTWKTTILNQQSLVLFNSNIETAQIPKNSRMSGAQPAEAMHLLENNVQMRFGLKGPLILDDVPVIQILGTKRSRDTVLLFSASYSGEKIVSNVHNLVTDSNRAP